MNFKPDEPKIPRRDKSIGCLPEVLLVLLIVFYLLIGCASSKSHKTLIRATLYGKWGSSSIEATDVDSVKIDTVLVEIKK